jgi:hypothetical protein
MADKPGRCGLLMLIINIQIFMKAGFARHRNPGQSRNAALTLLLYAGSGRFPAR